MKATIDPIVGALPPPPGNTGLVVGLIHGDERRVMGFGRAGEARPDPPNGETVFEIGSISKVFTTTLLALLVAEGRLRLEDRVCDLVPSLSHLPAGMTLLRLATHTAGLPKMPGNLLGSMLRNPRNPYAAYSTADLLRSLARYRPPRRRTGTDPIRYSNLGAALLGQVLAQASDCSYEAAVTGRICDPLSMPDTRIELGPEQAARLAPPHSASGKPVQPWDLPAFAPAGGLRSTANDLLAYLAANLGRARSPLAEALPLCHEVRSEAFPRPGRLQAWVSGRVGDGAEAEHRRQGMALGWFVGQPGPAGPRVLWHHGATGGYRAFAGFVPGSGTGVVVLANRGPARPDLISGSTSADDLGFRLLEALHSGD